MPSTRHPKLELHDAIAAALADDRVVPGPDGLLTRWVLVGELALPDRQMSLVTLTSTASGQDLRSWETYGLLGMALHRVTASRGGP